jgi:uncharacterized protein YdaT
MARKTHHVVPSLGGGWNIKKGGSKRASDPLHRKTDAIERAREISRNHNTELVIHNRDGKISRADSHGNDRCPPKDRE